jgi:thioredoxin 1
MSNVTEVTDATFATEVMGSAQPVLVDYWAEWCSPCKQLSPIVEELAGNYAGKIKVCKIDTDANPNTALQQGVQALPTLQVIVNGQVVQSMQGGKTKTALSRILDEYV